MTTTTPRMRTAPKVVEELRAMDPETDVTVYAVRQLIQSGQIPVVRVGKKALVNLDDVLEYLRVGYTSKEEKSVYPRQIQKINERIGFHG